MRCPFLREAQIESCRASEFSKTVARREEDNETGRCSSPSFVSCPAIKEYKEESPIHSHCPFLQESLTRYCSAAPVTKYVPYDNSSSSRCGNSNHRYCELFLETADKDNDVYSVDGIRAASWLFYSPNHMWIDIDEEGFCHIGIDAFLTKALGNIDRLSFSTTRGYSRPSVSITANENNFQLIFPKEIFVSAFNGNLRAAPDRVSNEPYTNGWLFEGIAGRNRTTPINATEVSKGFISGKDIRVWMQNESRRLSEFMRTRKTNHNGDESSSMNDGGTFSEGVLRFLDEREVKSVYNSFFSPNLTCPKFSSGENK